MIKFPHAYRARTRRRKRTVNILLPGADTRTRRFRLRTTVLSLRNVPQILSLVLRHSLLARHTRILEPGHTLYL